MVDPADFEMVHEVMELYGLKGHKPTAILSTHKHWDHAGHNQMFADAYPGLRIVGGQDEGVYASTY